jgi:hypothetical protein
MAAGLFGTHLTLNPKCLVFSLFVLIVYWMPHFKPLTHRILMAFLLACVAYVSLAWYDMIYDCKDRLKPTFLGWMWGWAKPPEYMKAFMDLPEREQKLVRTIDIVVLVGIVVLFFLPFLVKK